MARRSLWPREHGAYFQLAIPLLAACARQVPSVAMVLLAAGASLAFLANEPLVVVLGHRGARRQQHDGARARTRLAWLAGGAVALGGAGLVLAPPGTLVAALAITAPVAALIACGCTRTAHTLLGELIAASALPGAALVVLVAGGVPRGAALASWLGWSIGFAASVLAVHRIIARHKRAATPTDRALALGLVATLTACLALASRWSELTIATPLVGLATILVIAPPPATRLRAAGIAVVAAALGSAAIAWNSLAVR